MQTMGLDLAVQAAHKAMVTDEQGSFITPILTLRTRPGELDQLLVRARNRKPEAALQVGTEPTGMAWFPIAVYPAHHDVAVCLVNSQEMADLRCYYERHAKSDRIDARVLTRLPLVNPRATAVLPLALSQGAGLSAQLQAPWSVDYVLGNE